METKYSENHTESGEGTENRSPNESESFENAKNELREEISESIKDLKESDQEIHNIEQSIVLQNPSDVDQIKRELDTEAVLEDIKIQADQLEKETLSKLETNEKLSFWNNRETLEEKILTIEELFKSLDVTELAREDTETSARGWNVTHNIAEIEKFKEILMYSLSERNKYRVRDLPNFEELISQKSYQDIVWAATNINPEVFHKYGANKKFNIFIQERPEFLESSEAKLLYVSILKNGIKNGTLFEGYRDEIPESEKENQTKSKRTEIPDDDSGFAVNLERYEFDSSLIDSLSPDEKSELAQVFLEKIGSNMYGKHRSENIFADEIISVGKKLNISEDQIHDRVFKAMINGVLKQTPPAHGIDKEFTEINKKIEETLTNPEKRQVLLNSLYDTVRQKDADFNSWRDSFEYMKLDETEKEEVKNAYLNFSSGEKLHDKCVDIFGYAWWNENDFPFSEEDRLRAFQSMNSEQKSDIALSYKGSMEKIKYLNFNREDILAYAVKSLNNEHNVWKSDVDQAKRAVEENFPGTDISTTDIIKRAIFKNTKSLTVIQQGLERNDILLSPKEIIEYCGGPKEFVSEQIKGGYLTKLSALEGFRNNPDTPPLTVPSKELFDEIKQNILENRDAFQNNHTELKELIAFVPKDYKISMMTDEKLQVCFSDFYKKSLKEGNIKFADDLRFVISKSDMLQTAEKQAYEEYIAEGDLFNLSKFYTTVIETHHDSPILKNIEELFSQKLKEYEYDFNGNLNSNNLQQVLRACASEKLNKLTPENSQNVHHIQEWINLIHGSRSREITRVYSEIKDVKSFSFFDEKIRKHLFNGNVSEKFIALLQNSKNSEEIDRVVNFNENIKDIFDTSFLEKNWDYLHTKLKSLNPEEYEENLKLLKETRPLISSPFLYGMSFENLFEKTTSYTPEQREQLFQLIDTRNYAIKSENPLSWAQNTILYVNEMEEHDILQRDQDKKETINHLFSGDYKNSALFEMSKEWKDFLSSDSTTLPPQLFFVSKVINEAGGAGNLKHIESLGNLSSQIQATLEKETTASKTNTEIKNILTLQENRFNKEKWSQDEISEFYNLSKDIIEAAPSLYTSLSPILETISPKDIKKFMTDVFPFYQTQLVVMQNIEGETISYNPRQLVEMRQSIQEFSWKIQKNEGESDSIFESEKIRLLEIAKNGFKERFGLLKVPENFTKENLRSIQNTIRYMGNINSRTPQKEALISLYLGLELDNKWTEFRSGAKINFADYVQEKQLAIINPLLEEKEKSYTLVSEVADITPVHMPRFQEILQDEVSNNLIGNIQTIDVKLGNIKRNIDDLIDPDIYETQKEKDILDLFLRQGKNVNAILAKIYGISSGKKIELSENEETVKQSIESIFDIKNWTTDAVKKIQDEVQPLGLVTNMVTKMQEEKIDENIQELQNRLVPNNEIIDIFNKLGEQFHPESGAIALSKDLSYLENIIVKDENKITKEERKIVADYIESIREKMKDLEIVSDHITQHFDKLKKSSHLENNTILKNRITEIEKIIYSQDTSSVITSQMTKDLNLVIENMRQCLGCMRKEANNDTNLSFGDYNKFFMMNKSEKEKGSISDEIVFFVPVTIPNDRKEMSFVMDQVYGSKSADVLVGNISAVYKKYQALKKEFPESKLSISVTSSAIKSVGLTDEILEKKLKEILSDKIITESFENLVATIPLSSLSDNYVEFGIGTARQSGDRKFSGLTIR